MLVISIKILSQQKFFFCLFQILIYRLIPIYYLRNYFTDFKKT